MTPPADATEPGERRWYVQLNRYGELVDCTSFETWPTDTTVVVVHAVADCAERERAMRAEHDTAILEERRCRNEDAAFFLSELKARDRKLEASEKRLREAERLLREAGVLLMKADYNDEADENECFLVDRVHAFILAASDGEGKP